MKPEDSLEKIPLGVDGLKLDLSRRGVYRGNERIHLTPKPFEVLAYLVRNRGRVVPKNELLDGIWGEQHDDNTVEQAVRQIRRALQDDKDHPRFVQTIQGLGYCFIGASEAGTSPAADPPALALRRSRFGFKYHVALAGFTFVLLSAAVALRPSVPNAELANPVKITRSQTRILSPILTDGRHLFYQRFNNGRYMVDEVAAGGGRSITPVNGISNPELCDISPNGGSLLLRDLVQSRDDNEPVYIQPISGGSARRVGKILAYDVAWYRDSRHILYSANGTVYRTDTEGASSERPFSVPGHAYWFRWSPDAGRFRFTVMDRETEAKSLWDASADGSQVHRLFHEFQHQQCCGSWTPDGKFRFSSAG